MAYDETLVDAIRDRVGSAGLADRVAETRMFGGLAFVLNGNMAVAATREGGLLLRADPADSEDLLATQGAGPVVMRGREVAGWVRVDGSALGAEADRDRWIGVGLAYTQTLKPKKAKK